METNKDLEDLLRMYIAGNNEIIAASIKTKRRDNVMMLIGALFVIILFGILIYVGKQSFVQSKYVLEHIDNLNKAMDSRKRFLEFDRKDAADNLQKSVEILRYNDSTKKQQDSISELPRTKMRK